MNVTIGTGIFGVGLFIRDSIKGRCVNHFAGDAAAELLDLFADIQKKGIGAPTTKKYDGIYRDAV